MIDAASAHMFMFMDMYLYHRLAQAMDNFVAHRCTDKDLLHQTKEELRKLQVRAIESGPKSLVKSCRSCFEGGKHHMRPQKTASVLRNNG